jgi:primosomal protein N' (replication factor Y) (superfamily II helicase)
MMFADIILPLALERNYTFGVPLELQPDIKIGCRVEVQFGNKRVYSGIVKHLHDNKPEFYNVKPIRNLLDPEPMVTQQQLQFWEWLASYYACTEGEVMNVALPSYLKLESETFLQLQDGVNIDEEELSDDEYMVLQALEVRKQAQKKE